MNATFRGGERVAVAEVMHDLGLPLQARGKPMTPRSREALHWMLQASWHLWTVVPKTAARTALEYGRGSAVLLKTAATNPPAPHDATPDPLQRLSSAFGRDDAQG